MCGLYGHKVTFKEEEIKGTVFRGSKQNKTHTHTHTHTQKKKGGGGGGGRLVFPSPGVVAVVDRFYITPF